MTKPQMPERRLLRAGPFTAIFEDGDLRYVKLSDREVWRRIYSAVRDRNWGTVLPVFTRLEIDDRGDSFCVSYDVENRGGEIDFAWTGEITGTADGVITFMMDGVAHSTFWRNRIGFCLLHPLDCAGAACRVEHVDGTTESAVFPVDVIARQPVPPFAELRAVAHEVAPGLWAEARFSGDIFEMEDQRNWSDASFKTFCTPLRMPYPVEIKAGTRVVQSVVLSLKDERPANARTPLTAQPAPLSFMLRADVPAVPLPQIGLGAASSAQPLDTRAGARLRALNLRHLRVTLRLAESDYLVRLRSAIVEAQTVGAPLEVAVLISPDEAETQLHEFRRVVDELKPCVATWLVHDALEHFGRTSPVAELAALARQYLADYDPAARFGGGTNSDFLFIRLDPPPALLDLACFALNPQVHAFDSSSLVETLAAQGVLVADACRLAGGRPVAVTPITLKPCVNPYTASPEPDFPPVERRADARQGSLFGAAWTLGSLKYVAENGAVSVTYYETTGPLGVMEAAGGVFPLYHVLADVGEFAGGQVIPSVSNDTLKVDGLALHQGGWTRVILANVTAEPQQVTVQGLSGPVRVRLLDETIAEAAMQDPETFRAQAGTLWQTVAGALTLDLLPCAVARIDSVA